MFGFSFGVFFLRVFLVGVWFCLGGGAGGVVFFFLRADLLKLRARNQPAAFIGVSPVIMPFWADRSLHRLHRCPSLLEVSRVVLILFIYKLKTEGFFAPEAHISARCG